MKNTNTLTEQIINTLKQNKQTLSFAESCTGGRLASAFTAISGASSVFNGSCVTYSNEIKHLWLGVENQVLEEFGAVSRECVAQMLSGMSQMAKSDYTIAVSGIAGPSGGTELKPVGTVFIGIRTPLKQEVFHCLFEGSREEIQAKATVFSIKKLALFLQI